MCDLVRWRKTLARREEVLLPESVLRSTAPQTDFEGLLSDVLDEVLAMDGENWPEKTEALAELLRPYVER